MLFAFLFACSANKVQSSKVGYDELSNSIKSGQRLQLVMKEQGIINIRVDSLHGDVLSGTAIDDPKKVINVNLNNVSKIRVYQ